MIPKFSIKQMLLGMIAVGVLAFLMARAYRGNRIAFGLAVASIGTLIPFLAYAAIHWLSFLVALIPIPGLGPPATAPNVGPDEIGANPFLSETDSGKSIIDSGEDQAGDVGYRAEHSNVNDIQSDEERDETNL